MGGGNRLGQGYQTGYCGLSPRGRGKLLRPESGYRPAGSIPAWAGETGVDRRRLALRRVYPRVGGGNLPAYAQVCPPEGLSPRGRGKLRGSLPIGVTPRSIPAWAGETCSHPTSPQSSTVYPRVGGGNSCVKVNPIIWPGLSPRGRGKPGSAAALSAWTRSIPAWAGETCQPPWATGTDKVYPRVGGGNGVRVGLPVQTTGLSPRGRGKRLDIRPLVIPRRSIPAWAGETRFPGSPTLLAKVYPRVGGGNNWPGLTRLMRKGLSPRGRGKPVNGQLPG